MKLGTNSTTRFNAFTSVWPHCSTMQNLFSFFEFNFEIEQKMCPNFTTLVFIVLYSLTLAVDINEFPYDDCQWLDCVGIKGDNKDCIKTQDCDVLLIRSVDYSQLKPLLAHRLYWIPEANANPFRFAAVGYSNDTKMGDDDVTLCYEIESDLQFTTGVSNNEKVIAAEPSPISELYAKKSEVNLCAWTTKTTFTKKYLYEREVVASFDLSKQMHILLARGRARNPKGEASVTLYLASNQALKFDPVPCNSQAHIFESFYCWGDGTTMAVSVLYKEKATRFELAFRNMGPNGGTISMGLSLYPLPNNISLVKCNWNQGTVSIVEAFQSGKDIKDLTADPPIAHTEGHIGNTYMECIWSRSSNFWKHNSIEFNTSRNPFYLSMQSNNAPKFSDWPLVFPDFTDDELENCGENCVGMRDANETDNKCVEKNNCIITLVVYLSDGKYLFSFRSALTFGVWTSVSLSAEESSNEKLGFDCAIKDEVDAKPFGEVTTTTNKVEKGSNAVKILDAKLTDDGPRRMTCEFEVENPITLPVGEKGTTIDLEKNGAFITIAFGSFSGQKEKAKQSVSFKSSPFKLVDIGGQAERTFLVILSLTFVALFVVSTLSVIGLGLYLYHPKKRKGVKVKKGAKRKSLKIQSRKSSPVGSKIDKGSPTSNI